MSLFLTSCVPPVYEGTTYGLEDFMTDSSVIANQTNTCISLSADFENKETVIDGDVLFISLYCPKRSEREAVFRNFNDKEGFRINEGQLHLPSLPPIFVDGLSLPEVQQAIQETVEEEWGDAKVFVSYKNRKTRFVQIIGATTALIPLEQTTTLYEVLAKAHLSSYANLYKSYVVRDEEKLPINFYNLIHNADPSQNIIMRGGDQIFIAKPDEVTIMLTGEIRHPRVVPLPYGCMPLLHALAVAGGIPFTGDMHSIIVIRSNKQSPKIYQLDWNQIINQPSESLLLTAGDVVYISETPLTQWNRFIEQLQPSATCVNTGYGTYLLF